MFADLLPHRILRA